MMSLPQSGAPLGSFDSALLAYGYNLFNQDGVEILEECEARGIAVHVAGAFMMGVFDTASDTKAPPPGGVSNTSTSNRPWAVIPRTLQLLTERSVADQQEREHRRPQAEVGGARKRVRRSAAECCPGIREAHRHTLSNHSIQDWLQLLTQWIAQAFAPKCVTKIVLGMADPSQVADNMGYVTATQTIPAALWVDAKRIGLIADNIPVPE